jgi:hypothetical protein
MDLGIFSSGAMVPGGGLGNLADELAAFSDGDDDDYYGNEGGPPDISFELQEDENTQDGKDTVRDSGVDVESPPTLAARQNGRGSLSLPSPGPRGHRRATSDYDGSEYGSEGDLESPGMPPKLVEKIAEVESLARRGTENSPSDGALKRVTDGLRDLGSQSGVEGGASRYASFHPSTPLDSAVQPLTQHRRLITAHSALTTHLSHQTRQLHNLTFPILSPLVAPPDAETVDTLLPMLVTLTELMPRPSTNAYNSLSSLHTLTADLVQTLNYLSDTLHMSRQTTNTATRRLKSAKDLVAELRRDEELREEGERWLDRGNWGERLRKRECAHVCGEVVGGFEEVCNSWRARLVAQAEST